MLNESIIKIRVELQKAKLKKSGKNKYAGFQYFELSDFLPKLNELMNKEKINDIFSIENEEAKLILIKGEEKQEYKMPFKIFETPISTKVDNKTGEVKKIKSMQDIQYLGALNTYYKRYLYINAFGITDGEIIDGMNNDEIDPSEKKPTKKEILIQKSQIEILQKNYVGENMDKLLKVNGLEKLEDMTMLKASELIKKINEKKENKDNE